MKTIMTTMRMMRRFVVCSAVVVVVEVVKAAESFVVLFAFHLAGVVIAPPMVALRRGLVRSGMQEQ